MGYLRTRPLRKKVCPECDNSAVIFIHYGSLDIQGESLIQEGKMKYGGPIKLNDAPDRFCTDCGHTWLEPKQFEVHT